jgi:hypothetical protein
MVVNLLNIEATLRRLEDMGLRIEKLLQPQKREPRTVKLTDAEWLDSMTRMYPQFDVPALLRDCEAHYVSKGQVMTRAKGAAWLKRQVEWDKPVTVPAKKGGLVL